MACLYFPAPQILNSISETNHARPLGRLSFEHQAGHDGEPFLETIHLFLSPVIFASLEIPPVHLQDVSDFLKRARVHEFLKLSIATVVTGQRSYVGLSATRQ